MLEDPVLISVGVPVRNGATALNVALQSIVDQTYKNIEIIISDNNSSDETERICQEFSSRDSRIIYYKQQETMTALENFQFVFEKSRGEYFMWAAYDDSREENYIEALLSGFQYHPEASIIFSNVSIFENLNNPYINNLIVDVSLASRLRFDSQGLSFIEKHIQQRQIPNYHIYGLINSKNLACYPWFDIDHGPDYPLLHWLLCHGDFIYVDKTIFYYYEIVKSIEERALTNSNSTLKAFPIVRLSHFCTLSIIKSKLANYSYLEKILNYLYFFFFFYLHRHGGLINLLRKIIYAKTPLFLQNSWRKNKNLYLNKK
jgi:glycosyltransferase involved in cell wall biosynthesis